MSSNESANSHSWEQSGAIPMPMTGGVHYERNLTRLIDWQEKDGLPESMLVNAPFVDFEGASRLGVNSNVNGAIKAPVRLEASAHHSEGVIFTSVALERGTMGRPLLGYSDGEARSYYGDELSKDVGITAIKVVFFDEGYSMLSFEKGGNSRISNDVTPEEVVDFMNICFDVARYAKSK